MTFGQQDGTGRYVSGLQSGASPEEQTRSGAQPWHQPWEVDSLVNIQRSIDASSKLGTLGSYSNPVGIGGVSAGGGTPFSLGWFGHSVLFLVVCAAVGFSALLFYERYAVPLNSYNPMGVATGAYPRTALIEGLFKPGTVLKKDQYGGINWVKLNALRSHAKKPETYEQDLCTALHNPMPIWAPADLRAQWSINANGYCVATDAAAIIDRAKLHNGWYAVISIAGAVATLTAVGWLMFLNARANG